MCAHDGQDGGFCDSMIDMLRWAREGKALGWDTMFIAEDSHCNKYPIYANIDNTLGLELKIDRRVAKCVRLTK
ncbi:MAG: hypothetical protein KAS32_11605 [Candidatus Peribacteraceae bacterium]|nr:hypothetical protein [Candidatus Peribacteraceae bacterium]